MRARPTLHASALEPPGIYEGPDFIGLGPDSVRRVRQYAAILRGDLLRCRGTRSQPGREHERAEAVLDQPERASGSDRLDQLQPVLEPVRPAPKLEDQQPGRPQLPEAVDSGPDQRGGVQGRRARALREGLPKFPQSGQADLRHPNGHFHFGLLRPRPQLRQRSRPVRGSRGLDDHRCPHRDLRPQAGLVRPRPPRPEQLGPLRASDLLPEQGHVLQGVLPDPLRSHRQPLESDVRPGARDDPAPLRLEILPPVRLPPARLPGRTRPVRQRTRELPHPLHQVGVIWKANSAKSRFATPKSSSCFRAVCRSGGAATAGSSTATQSRERSGYARPVSART